MSPSPLSMVRKANQKGETPANVALSARFPAQCDTHHAAAAPSPNSAPNLCALISNADLRAIRHQNVQGPRRDAVGTCIWRIAG
jgi:hypothetical protein